MKDVSNQGLALPRAAGASRPAAASVLLQRMVFDRPASLRPLYVRVPGAATACTVVEAGELHLPARRSVSFDT
jgi:hypothetical protein